VAADPVAVSFVEGELAQVEEGNFAASRPVVLVEYSMMVKVDLLELCFPLVEASSSVDHRFAFRLLVEIGCYCCCWPMDTCLASAEFQVESGYC
jgi:hypothetical protein